MNDDNLDVHVEPLLISILMTTSLGLSYTVPTATNTMTGAISNTDTKQEAWKTTGDADCVKMNQHYEC